MNMMMLLHTPGSVSSGCWQSGLPSGGGSLSWNSDTCCMHTACQQALIGQVQASWGAFSCHHLVRRVHARGPGGRAGSGAGSTDCSVCCDNVLQGRNRMCCPRHGCMY